MPRHFVTSLRQAMAPEMIRPLQIITIALAAGPGIFLFVIFFLLFQQGDAQGQQMDLSPEVLLAAVGIIFVSTAPASIILFRMQIKQMGELLKSATERPPSETAALLVARYSTAWIIRCALQEGAALFGLVFLFLTARAPESGDPAIWAAIIPYLFFLANVFSVFPTVERILTTFQTTLPDLFA